MIMDKLKVVSLNMRGLQGNNKRRKIFRHIKDQKAHIYLLQEVHGEAKTNHIWANQWGNKCLFSNGSRNACGVAILLTKSTAGKIREVRRDMQGRYIFCKIEMDGYDYCIGNIYSPNCDDLEFFEEVSNIIEDMQCIHVILGGDFNVVLDPVIDRNCEARYNSMACEKIKEIQDRLNLCDIWRAKHPDKRSFTWCKTKPRLSWSRIDYFLISQGLTNRVHSAEIEGCIHSDHSSINISIESEGDRRGLGVWKFNNELLNDPGFCNEMQNIIVGASRVYSAINPHEKWEMIVKDIVKFCKEYAKKRAKDSNFKLYQLLSHMQDEMLATNCCNNTLHEGINRVRREIDSFDMHDAKRAAFRCKADWSNEG